MTESKADTADTTVVVAMLVAAKADAAVKMMTGTAAAARKRVMATLAAVMVQEHLAVARTKVLQGATKDRCAQVRWLRLSIHHNTLSMSCSPLVVRHYRN